MNSGVTSGFLSAVGFPAPGARNHSGNYGMYFLAEQQLFREKDKSDPAKQGLVGFFRLGGAPADRNLAQFGDDGGLVYQGLIPSRDWDTLAVGASYLSRARPSPRPARRKCTSARCFRGADHESVLEVSYKLQMTAWWTLQSQRPKSVSSRRSAAIPDATVLILQTTVRF